MRLIRFLFDQNLAKVSFQLSYFNSNSCTMQVFINILILLLLFNESSLVTLQCDYKFRQFTWETSLIQDYGCKATIVPNAEADFVTEVSRNHIDEETFDSVKIFFYSYGQNIPKLPKLGFKFYPNLEAFSASRVSLEKISSRNS